MTWMAVSESLWDEILNGHSYEFIVEITEQFRGAQVCVADGSVGVCYQDPVGRKLEKILERQVGDCCCTLVRQCNASDLRGMKRKVQKSFLTDILDPGQRATQPVEIPVTVQQLKPPWRRKNCTSIRLTHLFLDG
jgi:hypothetical protein